MVTSTFPDSCSTVQAEIMKRIEGLVSFFIDKNLLLLFIGCIVFLFFFASFIHVQVRDQGLGTILTIMVTRDALTFFISVHF